MPPLREQQRIVEAIESYFTRLDDAVATLERVQRNLKRYRASVLKAAVEGRLVPTEAALAEQEGRDYEPASVLLERILTERRRRWAESGKKGKYQEPSAARHHQPSRPPRRLVLGDASDQLVDSLSRSNTSNAKTRFHSLGRSCKRRADGRVAGETDSLRVDVATRTPSSKHDAWPSMDGDCCLNRGASRRSCLCSA